jgi:hypothetical protein
MRASIASVLLEFGFLAVFLGGCAPASKPVPATSTQISATTPPAARPTPTQPPTVTSTPTIEPPSVMTEFLTDVKVLSYDPFDNGSKWDWDSQTTTISNGILKMEGTSFWASSFSLKRQLAEGDGIVLRFKVQKANAQSQFVFVTGDWQTESFRQFGIDNGKRPTADLWQGKNDLGEKGLAGSLKLQPDTWYAIIMAIGKNGQFLAVMWDTNSEGHRAVYKETVGVKWANRRWLFLPKANAGETVYVDDFYGISFGEIK